MTRNLIGEKTLELIDTALPATETAEWQKGEAQPKLLDCLFIFAVMIVSALPYLAGLGFYYDDWEYQASPILRAGHGILASMVGLMKTDPDLLVRPVQAAYLALSFKAFGHHPLPYHVAGTLLIALVPILLYIVLVELRMRHRIALAISLLYGLLPQYSTDRFWWASQQAVLCMIFALIGIYAIFKSIQSETRHPKLWMVLSTVVFVLSILSYEVSIGLIAAAVLAIGWHSFRGSGTAQKRRLQAISGLAIVLLAVGIVKIRLQSRIVYNHHLLRFLGRLGNIAVHAFTQSIQFDLWSYCLHLPWVLAILWQNAALTGTAVASATAIAVLVSMYFWQKPAFGIPSKQTCLQFIVTGFILFFLGTFLFIRDVNKDFSFPGLSNRVNITAALGEPFIWIALISLACSLLKNPARQMRTFSVALGLICGFNCLTVSGIAHYWQDATARQSAILESVASSAHSLPHGSTLLLDGFCRFNGIGVVFESSSDATGAIWLSLKDDSLHGDVVSSYAHFGPAAVDTTVYGMPDGHYPYGSRLFVYNLQKKSLIALTSSEIARQYLRTMNPTGNSGCPEVQGDDGTRIF